MALTGLLSAGFVQSLRWPPPRCKCAHISRGPLSLSHSNNNNSVGVNLPIWPSSSIVRPDGAYLGNCCLAALVTSASFAKHRRYFHGTNRCDRQTLDHQFSPSIWLPPKKKGAGKPIHQMGDLFLFFNRLLFAFDMNLLVSLLHWLRMSCIRAYIKAHRTRGFCV